MSLVTDSVQGNRRRASSILVGFGGAVFLAVLLLLVLPLRAFALVPALAVSVGLTLFLAGRAEAMALDKVGALPADAATYPRFHNVVEGLCAAAGVPKPALFIVDDVAPNACSVGRDPRRASLVATTGLLEKLSRIELEAVVAHELSHIKSYDIAVSTLAVAFVGSFAPALVPKVVGPPREALADVTGVSLTRYPPGLISALETLRDDGGSLQSPHRAVAHLWIEPPAAFPSYPPLEERIQALREL